MDDYLMHYGRKGMKWYQHIYTDAAKAADDLFSASDDFDKLEKETSSLTKANVNTRNIKEFTENNKRRKELVDRMSEAAAQGRKIVKELLDAKDVDEKEVRKVLEKFMDNPKIWDHFFLEYNYGQDNNLANDILDRYGQKDFDDRRAAKRKIKHSDESFEDISDYLMHYGHRGMKWGQHIFGDYQKHAGYAKTAAKEAKITKKQEQKTKKQAAKKEEPKTKRIEDLSDADLEKLLKRARMEDEYRRLQPKKVSMGKRLVNNVLLPVFEQQAKNYLNAKIGQYVQKQISGSATKAKVETPKAKVETPKAKVETSASKKSKMFDLSSLNDKDLNRRYKDLLIGKNRNSPFELMDAMEELEKRRKKKR